MASTSSNTKEKSLHALKLLYTYLTIFNINLQHLTQADIANLQYFLKGISPQGYTFSLELISTRTNETINGYFSIYRSYVKYLNLNKSLLLKTKDKAKIITNPITEAKHAVKSYESNVRMTPKSYETPKYISVEEFRKVINVIRQFYGKREECIVRLMFQGGLRIGEVFGLTADDVVVEEIQGITTGVIYIRNRYTDKPYQNAKTCMNVYSRNQYSTEDYTVSGYGYQTVVIDCDLVDLINDYIDEVHVPAREKHNANYYKYTIADRIRESEPDEDDNYYVFINSLSKPLSYQSWKSIIRDIFIKADIPVDKNKRKYNINIEIKIVGNKVTFPFICIIKEIQRRITIKNKI